MTDKTVFSPFIKQCFVCATVCMNVLSNGCAYGFPAVLLPQLKHPDSPIPLTKAQESWIAHRSVGISVTTAMATGFHFAVLKTFPYLLSGVGIEGVYWIYASVICYGLSVIWFAMPETKGRTLQQIEDRFKGIERVVPEMESLNNNLKC